MAFIQKSVISGQSRLESRRKTTTPISGGLMPDWGGYIASVQDVDGPGAWLWQIVKGRFVCRMVCRALCLVSFRIGESRFLSFRL